MLDTKSEEMTLVLGRTLGHCLSGGAVVGLVGSLGAGKTHLVKGIAMGNAGGRLCEVTSPTFTLVHEYPGRLTLYHLDAYRLNRSAELVGLGFEELIRDDSAVVVEWADRVREAMPPDTLWIEISPLDDSSRRFIFRSGGGRSHKLLEDVRGLLVDSETPRP